MRQYKSLFVKSGQARRLGFWAACSGGHRESGGFPCPLKEWPQRLVHCIAPGKARFPTGMTVFVFRKAEKRRDTGSFAARQGLGGRLCCDSTKRDPAGPRRPHSDAPGCGLCGLGNGSIVTMNHVLGDSRAKHHDKVSKCNGTLSDGINSIRISFNFY